MGREGIWCCCQRVIENGLGTGRRVKEKYETRGRTKLEGSSMRECYVWDDGDLKRDEREERESTGAAGNGWKGRDDEGYLRPDRVKMKH